MTTLTTYQNLIEKVGLSKLDEANKDTYNIVKEGSSNFTDPNLWNEMLADADIREAYELHVKSLESLAREKAEQKAVMKVEPKSKPVQKKKVKPILLTETGKKDNWDRPIYKSEQGKVYVDISLGKGKREIYAVTNSGEPEYPIINYRIIVAKKPKSKRESKRPRPRVSSSKKVKKAVKKTVKIAKPKAVVKSDVKFPVTVKRFSKELQMMKRYTNMDGKTKSALSLEMFQRDLAKVLRSSPDRKPLLNDIHARLSGAIQAAKKNAASELKVTLDSTFKSKVVAIIKNPRPKMKVEYLAGVNGDQKKKPKVSKVEQLFGFMTADQAPAKPEGTFTFGGAIGKFLGEQQRFRSQIVIEGDYHSSKSELAKQIADVAIDMGMKVALVDWEQGGLDSKDTIASIKRNLKPENVTKLYVSPDVPKSKEGLQKIATHFDMIIVDSATKVKGQFSNEWLDDLRTEYPDTIWVILMQRNADGKTRGGSASGYNAPVVIFTNRPDKFTHTKNYAVMEKNRGNDPSVYLINSKKVVHEIPTVKKVVTQPETI